MGYTPRTRIIATVGPASRNYTVLRKMMRAGLDVVRLNFSHGSHREHTECVSLVRRLNAKYRRHIRIMADLEGYRIRVGEFKGARKKALVPHSIVWLRRDDEEGNPRVIPLDYQGDMRLIKRGTNIFIDDGTIVLTAQKVTASSVKARVAEAGELKPRKGLNIPGVRFPFRGLTKKDMRDLECIAKLDVDFIAQSFVRSPRDIASLRTHMKKRNIHAAIVAKVESREAIRAVDGIIDAADGVMIARGDMGIAVPIYRIPVIQKTIIKKCKARNKQVITATQMLERMTTHKRPTRAEVTDVANAILDGTDYVMLSGETAAGRYPVEAVTMMNQIISFTERHARA